MNAIAAVITGATGGIGRAIAKQLAEQGTSLILVGRDSQTLAEFAEQLRNQNPNTPINHVTCDIADSENRMALLEFVEQLSFKVDMLINNAGLCKFGLIDQQSEEQITQQIQVNTIYPILLMRQFSDYFRRHNIDGQVINVGSIFGNIGYPGFAPYSASKFALRGVTEALSREFSDTAIRFRYFAPRATQTDLNSENVVNMNNELKVEMDTAEHVAAEFMRFIATNKQSQYLGWPERLFVFINQLKPSMVSNALRKNLPTIKKYALTKP